MNKIYFRSLKAKLTGTTDINQLDNLKLLYPDIETSDTKFAPLTPRQEVGGLFGMTWEQIQAKQQKR